MATLAAEEKIRECEDDLVKFKRLAGVWKNKFSNSCNGIDVIVSRLRKDLEDLGLSDRLRSRCNEVRSNYEDLMRIYEKIACHEDMPELLFQTEYNEKMGDISAKMDSIEENQSIVMSEVGAEEKRREEKRRG